MATTYTFTNFNRVPKPWAGGPILLPDKVTVPMGYAQAANIAPKPFAASEVANAALGLYSSQNVVAAATTQGVKESVTVAEVSTAQSQMIEESSSSSMVKTELKRELSRTVDVDVKETSQLSRMCSTLEIKREAAPAPAAAPAEQAPATEVTAEAAPVDAAAPAAAVIEEAAAAEAAVIEEAAAQEEAAPPVPDPAPASAPAAAPAAAPAPAPAAAPAPAPAAAPPKMPTIPKGPRKPTLGSAGSAKVQQPILAGKIPMCAMTGAQIRGPFILALGKTFAPDSFICANPECKAPLQDCGFVEEEGKLFCEADYEKHFAPSCAKCSSAIKNDCVNAMNQTWHPECFVCFHCKTPIGTAGFHIEDGNQYCTKDWNELFTTKCYGCDFPIEPSDRWVEALGQNWHAECFNCAVCQTNLEGQSFYAKGGRPFCKKHASAGFR